MNYSQIKKIAFFIILFLLSSTVFSQTDPLKEFESFKKQVENDFNNYKDSLNKDYDNFKKAIWKEFTLFKTGSRLLKPKPTIIPEAKPGIVPQKPTPLIPNEPTITVLPDIELPEDDFSHKISPKLRKKLLFIARNTENHSKINFYGATLNFFYDDINLYIDTFSDKMIMEIVKQLSSKDEEVKKIIIQCINYAYLMNLNGYGLLQLIRRAGYKMYQNKEKAMLFTWYVLNKMGYDLKIGYSRSGHLFLLTPSKIRFLNTYKISQNGKIYYVINFNNKDLYELRNKGIRTYMKNPFQTKYILNFLFNEAPQIDEKEATVTRTIKQTPFSIGLSYNVSYVNLLAELPVLDYPVYFHIPVSKKTEKELEKKIIPLLENKTESQKVNLLLGLVQHGFEYKFDKDNFGRLERPQAPEEMFHYKYSDCEDHSALFAYLVNHFTDCEVVGILYSSHVATAVKFPNSRPNGYYLPKPYQDYLICDATYIGASIGQCIPKFIGVTPESVFKIIKKQ